MDIPSIIAYLRVKFYQPRQVSDIVSDIEQKVFELRHRVESDQATIAEHETSIQTIRQEAEEAEAFHNSEVEQLTQNIDYAERVADKFEELIT